MEKVLILGYYDKHNLGDEAYKDAFQILFESIPNVKLEFQNPENITTIDASSIIIGGGDVINDWFNSKFEQLIKKHHMVNAISIGITYESTLNPKYFSLFNQVYVR